MPVFNEVDGLISGKFSGSTIPVLTPLLYDPFTLYLLLIALYFKDHIWGLFDRDSRQQHRGTRDGSFEGVESRNRGA
jgi:hypothetical protein